MQPHRKPPCPIHNSCGGCSSMASIEAEQHAMRTSDVQRILDHSVNRLVPSPRPFQYRARLTLRPDDAGQLGYFRPRSHTHVPIGACEIAREKLNFALNHLPPMPSSLAEVELRTNDENVVLIGRSRARHGKRRRGKASGKRPKLGPILGIDSVVIDGHTLYGDPTLSFAVSGIQHRFSPDTFFQVNLEINALLVEDVRQHIHRLQPAGVLDLYAGAGNLSMPLAQDGIPVVMVESSKSAISDARRTAKKHDLSLDIRRADANRFSAGDAFFDVAILDPPRAGSPDVIPQLLLTHPRALVMVSCNPKALARDIRPARKAGYAITRLDIYEMFPQTPHVEVLCILERP